VSIWIPLAVLVVAPIVTYVISSYLELHPVAAASLVMVVEAGTVVVLATRVLAAWTPQIGPYLPGWTDWAVLIGTPLAACLTIAWGQLRTAGMATIRPTGRCGRCNADLYPDHAGRYFTTADGYVCPPEQRQAGQRRHQPKIRTARMTGSASAMTSDGIR
jgi:hypothetical protein